MSIVPIVDFPKWLIENSTGGTGFFAIDPLAFNAVNHRLTISAASAGTGGYVTTGVQAVAGAKTFVSVPSCSTLPSSGSHLANKAYVDQLVALGLSWVDRVNSFYEFTAGDPVGVVAGDRFIAISTFAPFTKDYIYEYTGSGWTEVQVFEGYCTYVYGDLSPSYPNMVIYYNGTHWSPISGAITHTSLLNLSSDDHLQYFRCSGRIGDILAVTNATASTSSATGCATFAGGIGVIGRVSSYDAFIKELTMPAWDSGVAQCKMYSQSNGNFYITPTGLTAIQYGSGWTTTNFAATTASSSKTTGCVTMAGGLGVAGVACATDFRALTTGDNKLMLYALSQDMTAGQVIRGLALGRDIAGVNSALLRYKHVGLNDPLNYGSLGMYQDTLEALRWSSTRVHIPLTGACTTSATGALRVDGGLVQIGADAFTTKVAGVSNGALPTGTIFNRLVFYHGNHSAPTCFEERYLLDGTYPNGAYIRGHSNFTYDGSASTWNLPAYIWDIPLVCNQRLTIASTTQSTSTGTGCMILGGGLGVAKNTHVGGRLAVGAVTVPDSGTASPVAVIGGMGDTDPQLRLVGYDAAPNRFADFTVANTATGGLRIAPSGGGTTDASNPIALGTAGVAYSVTTVESTLEATSTSAAGFVTKGGAGIGKKLWVAGDTHLTGRLYGGNIADEQTGSWSDIVSTPTITCYCQRLGKVVHIHITGINSKTIASGVDPTYIYFWSSAGDYMIPANYRPTYNFLMSSWIYHNGANKPCAVAVLATGQIRIYSMNFSFAYNDTVNILDLDASYIAS